jgi:lysophospholipase L1-like esterase
MRGTTSAVPRVGAALACVLAAAMPAWGAPPDGPARHQAGAPAADPAPARVDAPLALRAGDRIILLGNTLAERLQHFNHFETLLMTRFPEMELVVRNLGWSGDTVTLQPRPLNFGDTAYHLAEQRADVIIAFFGLNESFDDAAGLPQFESDLDAWLRGHLGATYNGRTAPRLALVSPIAHERLPHLARVDTDARNRELARYADAMRRAAAHHGVAFVDLLTPTRTAMAQGPPLTINGIHLNAHGDRLVAAFLMNGLGFGATMREATAAQARALDGLREQIRVKNEEFFRRWRPLNAEYVVGRRVEPFGSVSFPPELRALDARVQDLERQVWRRARGLTNLRYPDAPAGQSAQTQPPAREE